MASVEELKEALLRERIETADHLKNKIRRRKIKSINVGDNGNQKNDTISSAQKPEIKLNLPAMTETHIGFTKNEKLPHGLTPNAAPIPINTVYSTRHL